MCHRRTNEVPIGIGGPLGTTDERIHMTGYNPNCNNCFRCLSCRGEGTVTTTRSDRGVDYRVRATCPTCKGVGGKPGAGMHDHR